MKNKVLICIISLLPYAGAVAQAPFNTIDSININNINASVLVHGDMGWTGGGITYNSKSFYPNGSNKSINFANSIWMSAYDGGGKLHVAAQTYRQDGNDYWPGPLDDHDTLSYATSYAWAKIWKVNRTDVQTFLTTSLHTVTNTPNAILTWPAKGNTNAQGNGSIYLSITNDMAPFVDINGNGIYEPLLGDYPDFIGDQALWHVFSDNGPAHSQTNGSPLGVEVHAMSYAFKRGTLIDNVVYHDYKIINRSSNNYTGMRVGQWDDVEIGYTFDDYIGFDSTWRMGIAYNGTDDDGGSAGHPVQSFGRKPPQTGVTMIKLPGDVGTSYVPIGVFDYYNNDASVIGNPNSDTQCNYLLHGQLRNGLYFRNTFVGPGLTCLRPDSGTSITRYIFPGDPSNNNVWSECSCQDNPGDRRFILASNDFDLPAGSSQSLLLAFIVADSAGGCGATNFDKIRIVADTAWGNYFKVTGVKDVPAQNAIKVYPTPAHDRLYIETGNIIVNGPHFAIFNAMGQQFDIAISRSKNGYVADVGSLPLGIYYLRSQDGNSLTTIKFTKL